MLNPLFWLQAISLAFSQIWANKSRAFMRLTSRPFR